jgi:hypothetical protein
VTDVEKAALVVCLKRCLLSDGVAKVCGIDSENWREAVAEKLASLRSSPRKRKKGNAADKKDKKAKITQIPAGDESMPRISQNGDQTVIVGKKILIFEGILGQERLRELGYSNATIEVTEEIGDDENTVEEILESMKEIKEGKGSILPEKVKDE